MSEKLTYDLIEISVQPEPEADVSDFVPSIHFISSSHLVIETFTHPDILADYKVNLSSDEQSLCLLGAVTLVKKDDLTKRMEYFFLLFQPQNDAPIFIGDEVTINTKIVWKPRILDCCLQESVMGNC
jgi:hypothetical protein